jgi:hypothetical protein
MKEELAEIARRAVEALENLKEDKKGNTYVIYLVIAIIAGGLVILLGVGLMSEAIGVIAPPSGNPDAMLAYNKTVSTTWKCFQLSPLALLAMVFGAIISAVVGGFAFLGGRE